MRSEKIELNDEEDKMIIFGFFEKHINQNETNKRQGELKPIITNARLTFKEKRIKEREIRMDLSIGRSSLDRPIPFRLLLKFVSRLKVFQNVSDTKESFDL